MRPFRRHFFKFLITILTVLVGSQKAHAQEVFNFYNSTRSLGMGGAYVGVVNDDSAIISNPAGLAKVREFSLNFANLQLEGSMTDTSLFNSGNYTSANDAQGLESVLAKNPGTPFDARISSFPSIVMPDFGAGLLAKDYVFAYIDPSSTNYYIHTVQDFAPSLGYALKFWGGIVKIGFNGRLINRTEVNQTIAVSNANNLSYSNLQRAGIGLGSDVGLIIASPTAWLPAISAVAHDIGGTNYNLSNSVFGATTYRPADTPTTIDCAFSVFPILGRGVFGQFTGEVRDVPTLYQENLFIRRVHAGGEINFGDFFFLRGGMNQGYWTAGVEVATRFFRLQIASYGEEIGIEPNNVEDRRWVGSLGFSF